MTEQECLDRMVPPGARRAGKYREGVIQVWVTRGCDKCCFGCTQGSNLAGRPGFIAVDQFAAAVESLRGYFGVVGMFGGNPATHPQFSELCEVLRESWVPREQRGIWSNNPMTVENARIMRETFDPSVSNLNVHLDSRAYAMFKEGWPECGPVGLGRDSRHSPPFAAMLDLVHDEGERWQLISGCDINQHWSAMTGVFRGELRAWFCEVAGAQSMLHQDEPEYPDTGLQVDVGWWRRLMVDFREQVRKHCHECGVPLRGYGALAQDDGGTEQCTATHAGVYRSKRPGRRVEVCVELAQLGVGRIAKATHYLQNAGV